MSQSINFNTLIDRGLLTVRDLKLTRELFSNRADKLNERVHDHDTGWITEHFMPGHYLHLKGT